MTETTDLLDPRDSFALGVCYYPEHWPRERWQPYARQMRQSAALCHRADRVH